MAGSRQHSSKQVPLRRGGEDTGEQWNNLEGPSLSREVLRCEQWTGGLMCRGDRDGLRTQAEVLVSAVSTPSWEKNCNFLIG